jgi:peptide/nickel transport system substrate-binding protein
MKRSIETLSIWEDTMPKRQSSHSLLLAFSCLTAFVLLLGACATPPRGVNLVKGGTWIEDLYEEPDSLIPNASPSPFSDMVDQAIYAPLFVGDSTGNIQPGIATVIPTVANGGISADLKNWTFHLRPNLKWSDGQPLDARDVDFTWKLWTDPKFTPASTVGLNLITSADISLDNLTITFHLKQPFAPFLSAWVDGINAPMPAHHFRSVAPDMILTLPDNLNPKIVSGPFMMKESRPGDHYTVIRNPNYFRAAEGLPYLDGVVFRIVPDQDTILKDLQAGTIDSAYFLDVTKTVAYQRLSNYRLTSNPDSLNFEAFFFDLRNKILGQHPEVRQAMAMAVDHQALIDVARRGQAVPLCTDHGKGYHPGYQPNALCPKFDPTAANALLDQNGWVKGADGVRTKGDMRLEFEYSTTSNNLWRTDDELILQPNFQAIGVKIDIQNYPASTFGPFLEDGNPSPPTGGKAGGYDIAELEQGGAYDPDDSYLFACNQLPPHGLNFIFYCNPALDKLFIAEQTTVDPDQRQAIFNQIHQIYLTDFPFVVLYAPTNIAMNKDTVHNYNPGPAGAFETINIWQWWCSGGHC